MTELAHRADVRDPKLDWPQPNRQQPNLENPLSSLDVYQLSRQYGLELTPPNTQSQSHPGLPHAEIPSAPALPGNPHEGVWDELKDMAQGHNKLELATDAGLTGISAILLAQGNPFGLVYGFYEGGQVYRNYYAPLHPNAPRVDLAMDGALIGTGAALMFSGGARTWYGLGATLIGAAHAYLDLQRSKS